MWKLYFYGEVATPETFSLKDLATYTDVIGIPDDIEWFDTADIQWKAVNDGYIYRQFAGRGAPPALELVHKQ